MLNDHTAASLQLIGKLHNFEPLVEKYKTAEVLVWPQNAAVEDEHSRLISKLLRWSAPRIEGGFWQATAEAEVASLVYIPEHAP